MEPEGAPPTGAQSSSWQVATRVALALTVVSFGLWILHDFFPALAWAAVLAIALWPLYRHLLRLLPWRGEGVLGPLLMTLVVTTVVIAPLVLLGLALARESHVVVGFVGEARHYGVPVPDWIARFPLLGSTLGQWWQQNLSDPALADEMFGNLSKHLTRSAREYGGEIVHRIALLLFTLLTLFFLFRDGDHFAAQLRELSDRVIGLRGERMARQMIAAVHGTVTGLVLVGLAEGILLGIVYFAVGLPYPASVGAVTGVAAVIPFAAPAVYVLAALYLFAVGNTLGGITVVVFGSVLLFVADHFVRPVLIGGAARLPFLLVLFGILGGLETMGFIGLFLGPAVMAALVALWREWTEPEPVSTAIGRAAAARLPRTASLPRSARRRKG